MSEKKIAFVTGAARGIGKGAAVELASRGIKVYVTDILDEVGAETVTEINANGDEAVYMHLDSSNKEEIDAVMAKIMTTDGRLDYAVNNAGIGGILAPMHDLPLQNWQRMLDINLTGVFLCLQAELKAMLKTGGGSIVNISSLAGLNGMPYGCSYAAAKHGVIALTKSAAGEYGKHNIRVNSMCPGFIQTDILKGVPDEILESSTNLRVPLKRIGKVSEVAKSIAFLLSDDASYLTGMSMNIDGGFQAV